MINNKKNNFLLKLISLLLLLFLGIIGANEVLSFSFFPERYTLFKTENQGFKFYSLNERALYSRDDSKTIENPQTKRGIEIEIKRLTCDQNHNDECDKRIPNSNVGLYAYDVVKNNKGNFFKAYIRETLPSGRQPSNYIRNPSMDIFVTAKEFSAPFLRFPYYGDYKIYKRAPCDKLDQSSWECLSLGSFFASSSENTLYDLHFSNPFRNNDIREGMIGFYAKAFSTTKPTYSFSQLFVKSPQIDSDRNQVITNEIFRQLLISSLYRNDFFELVVDHNLWISPSTRTASIVFYGTSPSWNNYVEGHNCPITGKKIPNVFPCRNEINVFGFPLGSSDDGAGYFFRDFVKNYFKDQINHLIRINVSGRSGDWDVSLCYDNNSKKIFAEVTKIRDEDKGAGDVGYGFFSDGRIRLAVDTNDDEGSVKVYIRRVPFINRSCISIGNYQELINYYHW